MAQYRALVGIDYPPNKRAEAGEIVSDLPGDAIKWLLEDGLIEDSSKPAKKVETPVEETPLTVIDLSDGISSEEAKVILSSTSEAETIVSEDE
jgi:hypothetical protein